MSIAENRPPLLSGSDLLDIWDRGVGLPAPSRAVAVLSVALPSRTVAELMELPLGSRDRLLIQIFSDNFAPVIDGLADCAGCTAPIEVLISCRTLLAEPSTTQPSPLQWLDQRLDWRLPNTADLLAALTAADGPAAELAVLNRCVLAPVAGPAGELPAGLRAALAEAMEDCDRLADVQIDIDCPDCSLRNHLSLDVADYLWREIARGARGLVRDVATLAAAFGWTEPEVLALSPLRRQAYLELAHG